MLCICLRLRFAISICICIVNWKIINLADFPGEIVDILSTWRCMLSAGNSAHRKSNREISKFATKVFKVFDTQMELVQWTYFHHDFHFWFEFEKNYFFNIQCLQNFRPVNLFFKLFSKIRRMLPTIMIAAQEPLHFEAYGNIPCTRDTFKRVS